MLLKDAIMEYELECRVRRLAEGTINNYNKRLQNQAESEDLQKIRSDAVMAAVATLQQAYGKHYKALLARESRQEVAVWLGEATQPASVRAFFHRAEMKPHYVSSHRRDIPERKKITRNETDLSASLRVFLH